MAALTTEIEDFPFAEESRAAVAAFHAWKNRLLDYAAANPAEALFVVLTGGALVFYLAEKDAGGGVDTYDDALYYISTCLSVGYANLFPRTQLGKLVAAIVMAIGPSLSSWIIEGRVLARQSETPPLPTPPPPQAPDLAPVLEKLEAILQELKAQRGTSV